MFKKASNPFREKDIAELLVKDHYHLRSRCRGLTHTE